VRSAGGCNRLFGGSYIRPANSEASRELVEGTRRSAQGFAYAEFDSSRRTTTVNCELFEQAVRLPRGETQIVKSSKTQGA
jgi:hypothetical protein